MTHAMPRDPRDKTGRARLAAHERDSFDIQPGMSIGGGSFSGTGGGSALVDEYGQQMTPRDDYVSFLEQELNRLRGQASQTAPDDDYSATQRYSATEEAQRPPVRQGWAEQQNPQEGFDGGNFDAPDFQVYEQLTNMRAEHERNLQDVQTRYYASSVGSNTPRSSIDQPVEAPQPVRVERRGKGGAGTAFTKGSSRTARGSMLQVQGQGRGSQGRAPQKAPGVSPRTGAGSRAGSASARSSARSRGVSNAPESRGDSRPTAGGMNSRGAGSGRGGGGRPSSATTRAPAQSASAYAGAGMSNFDDRQPSPARSEGSEADWEAFQQQGQMAGGAPKLNPSDGSAPPSYAAAPTNATAADNAMRGRVGERNRRHGSTSGPRSASAGTFSGGTGGAQTTRAPMGDGMRMSVRHHPSPAVIIQASDGNPKVHTLHDLQENSNVQQKVDRIVLAEREAGNDITESKRQHLVRLVNSLKQKLPKKVDPPRPFSFDRSKGVFDVASHIQGKLRSEFQEWNASKSMAAIDMGSLDKNGNARKEMLLEDVSTGEVLFQGEVVWISDDRPTQGVRLEIVRVNANAKGSIEVRAADQSSTAYQFKNPTIAPAAKSRSQQRFEEDYAAERARDDAELQVRFKAQSVPQSTLEPRFQEIQRMNDQRRAQIKKASYELTKSRERPFSFYERDKEHKPPSSQKVEKFVFRANPIPASTSEPRYAQIQGEDHLRKQRINRMSQELLKEAKLPPRMERYEKGPGREKERQRKLREKAQPRGCTFKPQINPHIPEFERLQSEFEMLMARRKKEATGSQTFQSEEHLKRAPWAGEGTNDNPQGLRTESKDPKKVLNKVKKDIAMDAIILPEERWPFMSTRAKLIPQPPPEYTHVDPPISTKSTELRNVVVEQSRIRFEEEEQRLKNEERDRKGRVKAMSKRITPFLNDQRDQLLASIQEQVLDRKRNAFDQEQDYKNRLVEMQERVDNAPLLLQKDAKANAQNQIAHVVENTLDELNVNLGMY